MSDQVTLNETQRLYVIPCGKGFSCLGYDNAERERVAVLQWLGEAVPDISTGTLAHYQAYQDAMAKGAAHNRATGKRCPANLDSRLAPFEGERVEVTSPDGYKTRFIVGKSTGWMPCYLEVKTRRSSGGGAVYVPEGATIRRV